MGDIYNKSHCLDTTAKAALDNVEQQRKRDAQRQRAKDLLGCVIRLCSLAGYDVLEDITIRNRATGTVYSSTRNRNK